MFFFDHPTYEEYKEKQKRMAEMRKRRLAEMAKKTAEKTINLIMTESENKKKI